MKTFLYKYVDEPNVPLIVAYEHSY